MAACWEILPPSEPTTECPAGAGGSESEIKKTFSTAINRSPIMSDGDRDESPSLHPRRLLLADPRWQELRAGDGSSGGAQDGSRASWIGGELLISLGRHCKEHGLGWVFPADNGYQCFPHKPGLVRRADVSFIRRDRVHGGQLPKGWVRIPPDLAVEVVSPNDSYEEVEEKLEDYEKAGVPLIWVISPRSRKGMVYRADGSASRLREDDDLSGEDVIPGFRCPLREILPPARRRRKSNRRRAGRMDCDRGSQ